MLEQLAHVPETTCACPKAKRAQKREGIPLLFSIFIAILPKCPFCVFGYSSVMVLCSGAEIHSYAPGRMSYLPLGMAAAVVLSLLWNYRGQRTWWALALALAGGSILAHAQRVTGQSSEYFIGVILVFFGVFVNGSFLYFWRKMKQRWLSFTNQSP